MWFKVDDRFWAHPKVEALEQLPPSRHAKAIALWTLAGSWCGQHETDGSITESQLKKLVPWNPKQAASDLCGVGLWNRFESRLPPILNANGLQTVRVWFAFGSWLDFNPSRNEIKTKRKTERTRLENKRKSHFVDANTFPTKNQVGSKLNGPDPDPDPDPDPVINVDDDVKGSEFEPTLIDQSGDSEYTRRMAAAHAIRKTWARNHEQRTGAPMNAALQHREARDIGAIAAWVAESTSSDDAAREVAQDLINGFFSYRKKTPQKLDWIIGNEVELATRGYELRTQSGAK